MFENVTVRGVHATRYIMSYVRAGGELLGRKVWEFEDWLKSLGLDEEEIYSILSIARNGKLELEISAAQFLAEKKTKDSERA